MIDWRGRLRHSTQSRGADRVSSEIHTSTTNDGSADPRKLCMVKIIYSLKKVRMKLERYCLSLLECFLLSMCLERLSWNTAKVL